MSIDRSFVTVPAHGSAEVGVKLSVPVATAGASNGAGLSFNEVAGLIELTPASAADNNGVTLRVPYYMVPRALSDVSTPHRRLSAKNPSTTATVTNPRGAIAGDADFYAWGLKGRKTPGKASMDIRAVGTQSFQFDATRQILVFAINTFDRWSNASTNEFDIYVDVDGDGVDDYIIVGVDAGRRHRRRFQRPHGNVRVQHPIAGGEPSTFLATAPTDSTTAELPLLSSQLCRPKEPCLSAANPRITYRIAGFDLINGGPTPSMARPSSTSGRAPSARAASRRVRPAAAATPAT